MLRSPGQFPLTSPILLLISAPPNPQSVRAGPSRPHGPARQERNVAVSQPACRGRISAMQEIDQAAFRATPLTREPFDFLVVPGFVKPAACAAVNADFPDIAKPGSFPVCELSLRPAFSALLPTPS